MKKNLTIADKRTKAHMMRIVGISAGTIKRRGWDEGTLKRKERRAAIRLIADRPTRMVVAKRKNVPSKRRREADRQRARGLQA